MTQGGTVGLVDVCCPICNRVGDPDKLVTDPRWAIPVHAECVAGLSRWPEHGRDPRGRSGDDSYNDYDAVDAA